MDRSGMAMRPPTGEDMGAGRGGPASEPSPSGPGAAPTLDQIYQQIMSQKVLNCQIFWRALFLSSERGIMCVRIWGASPAPACGFVRLHTQHVSGSAKS